MKIEKKCLICNNNFSTTDYLVSIGKGKFCSKKCCDNFKIGKKIPETTKIKISLSNIGKHYQTKEQREKISLANKGKIMSYKTRERMSIAKKGKSSPVKGKHWKLSEKSKERIGKSHQNENNWAWKGDNVGYCGLHHWVKRHLGNPQKCNHCGVTNKQIPQKFLHWANIDHSYKRNLIDWIPLCIKCHGKYDHKLCLRVRH